MAHRPWWPKADRAHLFSRANREAATADRRKPRRRSCTKAIVTAWRRTYPAEPRHTIRRLAEGHTAKGQPSDHSRRHDLPLGDQSQADLLPGTRRETPRLRRRACRHRRIGSLRMDQLASAGQLAQPAGNACDAFDSRTERTSSPRRWLAGESHRRRRQAQAKETENIPAKSRAVRWPMPDEARHRPSAAGQRPLARRLDPEKINSALQQP
jgi:hypothetical protein